MMAPPRGFKYDVVKLLTGIRERPVLWDRTLEIYKDKVERKNAWEEICNILEDRYEHMSREEKRATGEHIINKWTNIRDTFVKSVKNKGKPKKKYLLYDQLKFLTKVIPEEEINEEYCSTEEQSSFVENQMEEAANSFLSSTPSTRKKKRADSNEEYIPRKTKREKNSPEFSQHSDYEPYDTGSLVDFVEVDSKVESDPRVMNEDEAFFASLLPTVVRYDEDERLDFRIQVLSAMKNINDKKRRQNYVDN